MELSASARRSSPTREAELAIVGAGPVGLYAAYYAGFRGLSTIVLETLPMVGGQIATFYPDSVLYDVPGFPAVTGRELVDRLEEQMRAFPVELRLGEEVLGIAREGDALVVRAAAVEGEGRPAERAYRTRAVLLCAGIGSFAPQRLKDPEIVRFEGRGLAYHPPGSDAVGGQPAVVLGGTQHAVDVALRLAADGAAVTLVHRRDRLAASGDAPRRLAAARVDFVPFHDLAGLVGAERVESVRLADRRDGTERTVPARLVVPCYGYHADASALGRFGVRREGDAVLVDSRMASDVPGIWAAGDGAVYPGKVRVLAADFGEACTAVNNVAAAIVPGVHVFPGYSSHRKGAARRPG
jgi:thioredoxin reductase (NADPH)